LNKKNKRLVLILFVAVFISVLGSVALYMYLAPQKTTVYVFKENYPVGEVLTEDMLIPVRCDSSIVVQGKTEDTSSRFVTGDNIDSVLKMGDSLRVEVTAGMPLTQSILSTMGGTGVEMSMDPTKIAVTVPVTNITGVSSDLKDGSRVNIYVTGEEGATTLAFQDMRVLTTSQDSSGTIESATVECDHDQAIKLVYASNNSVLYFGLIDNSQYEYEEGTPSYPTNK